MPEIDPITGLPKELGAWENLAKESQKVTVSIIRKKFGKQYTVVEGINQYEVDIKSIAKTLRHVFACGGTAKDSIIELQGNHKMAIKKELIALGFAPDTIEIKAEAPRKKRSYK